MQTISLDTIDNYIQNADDLYYRLILIVGASGSGKTQTIQNLAKKYKVSIFNVNLVLSEQLLSFSHKQRAIKLPSLLQQITSQTSAPIFLDNTEILFDKNLQQDPLRLLQGLSRNQTVISSWNGNFKDKHLVYAEPEHPEFRKYESPDVLIVKMSDIAHTHN